MAAGLRKRLMLAAATVTGIVVASTITLRLWPSEPVFHRVELDVPPVEAALWFAGRYPKYFTSGETELGAWLASLDPRDREFIEAMGHTLAWAWVEHELESFNAHDPEGAAREAIHVVRLETLNQLEIAIEPARNAEATAMGAYVGDPHFVAGIFARLVRGTTNCEGQNHLVSMLLGARLEPTIGEVFSFDARMLGVRTGHEVVRVTGPSLAQAIYVDAWSNLPPFTVDPSQPRAAPLLAELGDPPAVAVPGLVGRAPVPAAWYLESGSGRVVFVPGRRAPTKPVDLEVRAPKLDPASLARRDPWRIYLFARILDIYDDPRAAGLYRMVMDRECEGLRYYEHDYRCAAAATFLERLEPGTVDAVKLGR